VDQSIIKHWLGRKPVPFKLHFNSVYEINLRGPYSTYDIAYLRTWVPECCVWLKKLLIQGTLLIQGAALHCMRAQRIARQASRSQMYVNRSNMSPASSSPSFLYACCAYREGGKTMEEEQSQVLCSNSKPIWIDNMCFWCRVTYPISHLTTRRTSPCPQCQLASQIAHIQRHLWCRSPSCRYQKLVAKSVWENFWP
jgi:hypothetical protein